MNGERDDASLRQYHEANAALDERPSPAARAAVLAAAARHVDAKPQSADSIDSPRPTGRRRWPLAAAAAVLLSSLAVMLATRTEHEMPRFGEPPADERERAAVAPPQQPQIAAPQAPPPAAESVTSPQPPLPPASVAQRRAQDESPRSAEAKPMLESPKLRKSAPDGGAEQQSMAPATAPTEPVAGALGQSQGHVKQEEGAADRARRNETDRLTADSATTAPPAAAPPAPSASRPAAARPDAAGQASGGREEASGSAERRALGGRQENKVTSDKEQDLSAEQWLKRIIELRRDGRHEEADRELKRFREQYPQVQVPPEALPPAGTR
jgi:hypothetical protein